MKPLSKTKTPLLRRMALRIEHGIYSVRKHITTARRGEPKMVTPEIYRCISFQSGIAVKGRVLAIRNLSEPNVNDSWWVNARRMLKRWITSECPFIPVYASVNGEKAETLTDDEGYFSFELPNPSSAGSIEISLPENLAPDPVIAKVVENDTDPELVIISDVDDTIFVSNTARLLSMVKTALTGNSLSRQVFPGIPEFYSALRSGKHGTSRNPFHYVTSSPWNLHALIAKIFDNKQIPEGGFFMTDWGLSETDWLKESNLTHKRQAILKIMDWHPYSKIVLLGDSSQHDTEIYVSLAAEFPERVVAVAIRNVTFLEEPSFDIPGGIPFILHEDTAAARKFVMDKLMWS